MTFCKGEGGLHQQLALYHVYYNFCLPHASLRLPLPQSELTHGTGSAKRWQPQTPAMAAGLTDHSQQGCEHAVGVGNGKGGSPEQATCVRTACFEDVMRGQRATGRP